jgi:hypothetical protein
MKLWLLSRPVISVVAVIACSVCDSSQAKGVPQEVLKQRGFIRDKGHSVLLGPVPQSKSRPHQFKPLQPSLFWNCIESATRSSALTLSPRFKITLLTGGFWRSQKMDVFVDERGAGFFQRGDSSDKYYFLSPCLFAMADSIWNDPRSPIQDSR